MQMQGKMRSNLCSVSLPATNVLKPYSQLTFKTQRRDKAQQYPAQ